MGHNNYYVKDFVTTHFVNVSHPSSNIDWYSDILTNGKKPQWQGFSPRSKWSLNQMLGFQGHQVRVPCPLVDTWRFSSVSQPDKVTLQGKLPHEKDHAISAGLHATLGISYFPSWPYFMDLPMSRAANVKSIYQDILSYTPKYCLMRPVMDRNCHTQGYFSVNPRPRSKSAKFPSPF